MAITLTDDVDTVDISESEVDKGRTPRTAVISTPNRPANIIQGFNSEGFTFSVTGVWVTAESFRPDYRATVERWKRNNILVKYSDGSVVTWCTIKDFEHRLVPGIPGTDVAIFFSIELAEAIRDLIGDSASGRIDEKPMEGGGTGELPTEGTFTTWTQTWTVQDTAEVWLTSLIDDTTADLKVSFFSNDTVKVRALADGAVIVTDSNIVLEPTTQARRAYSRAASIQGVYQVVPDGTNLQRFKVYKNGTLLFTSAALGFNVADIVVSSSGKYIAVIADTSNFDRLFLFTGA